MNEQGVSESPIEEIDTLNDTMVGIIGDDIVVALPQGRMPREQALRHAAWIVALVDPERHRFDAVLQAVLDTCLEPHNDTDS